MKGSWWAVVRLPSQQGYHDFKCHSRQKCRDTVHHLEKEQKLDFANVEVYPPAGSCREQKSQPPRTLSGPRPAIPK